VQSAPKRTAARNRAPHARGGNGIVERRRWWLALASAVVRGQRLQAQLTRGLLALSLQPAPISRNKTHSSSSAAMMTSLASMQGGLDALRVDGFVILYIFVSRIKVQSSTQLKNGSKPREAAKESSGSGSAGGGGSLHATRVAFVALWASLRRVCGAQTLSAEGLQRVSVGRKRPSRLQGEKAPPPLMGRFKAAAQRMGDSRPSATSGCADAMCALRVDPDAYAATHHSHS